MKTAIYVIGIIIGGLLALAVAALIFAGAMIGICALMGRLVQL